MTEQTEWIEARDGAKLFLRHWEPDEGDGPARGAVQIVHGMAEHSLRYAETAAALCARGYSVWAADMRGHGRTADLSVNAANKGGLPGHCADSNALVQILLDIETINMRIQKGGFAPFLLGHSWGSFLALGYIETFNKRPLSGCVLSGTGGPGNKLATFGAPFMAVLTAFRGVRRYSPLAEHLALGSFNKPFAPNRSPVDWSSRDEAEADTFLADPLCGRPCSAGFYRDLARTVARVHRSRLIARISRTLPLFVFSGTDDPVGRMGAGPTALVRIFTKLGMKDVEFVLYPHARHHCLRETNRAEVADNLINWLDRHTDIKGALRQGTPA
jgi:alpha-beta hydrolase superfamily lysophospholipase